VISVQDLSKSYAAVKALRGISFEMGRGEVVGFLGPNGAGKTTTLRILTGYMPATEGVVRVAGYDVVSQSRDVRRRVGYLPEDVPLYGDLSVGSFLRYVGQLKGVGPGQIGSEVDRVVELTGLEPMRGRLIAKCSRGYRQRTGLAMALLGDPPVLLLDEPTSGLDPNQVVEVRDLIRELSGSKTVLLSSHILSEVAQICSRVIIIHHGLLVASGTPAELTGKFGPRRRLTLRARGTIEVADLAQVPGVESVEPGADGEGYLLVVKEAEAVEPRLARAILERGGELIELRHEATDLEAVFRAVTAEGGDA
jgi:ABC-2 type transport system ATP-binding protein